MFSIALAIGLYSYLIFTLGVLGLFQKSLIFVLTSIYIIIYLYIKIRRVKEFFNKICKILRIFNNDTVSRIFFILIFIQAFINLIGALGPELSFDALWYHLTLPKIYLANYSIHYIPGGLLYYSVMPKLTEMLYVSALALGDEITAKLIHYIFGILTLVVVYKFSRKYLSKKYSLLAVLIFYSNLVVAWESIAAFVDLARAFFEIMAFMFFVSWWEKADRHLLMKSALMMGFAISVKLLSIGSLLIFSIFIIYKSFSEEKRVGFSFFNNLITFLFITFLIPLPWFIFSYINTGNPIYPFLTNVLNMILNYQHVLNPITFVTEIWQLLVNNSDPIIPIYLIILPIIIIYFNKLKKTQKIIAYYSLVSILIWYFTPRIGGGRFILPYLPVFSVLSAIVINMITQKKLKYFIISTVVLLSITSIGYRAIANYKYFNYILGKESKDNFLAKNLNYEFGDFYDIDGFFEKNIKKGDMVLIYGIHNLYYVNFPFIHESWAKRGDKFNYLLLKEADLPERFKNWKLFYKNDITKVSLYKIKGDKWSY